VVAIAILQHIYKEGECPERLGVGDGPVCRSADLSSRQVKVIQDADLKIGATSSLQHVVKGQFGVPHNLVEDSFPQIAFAMDRDGRPAPVRMDEDSMAPRLTVQGKATSLENGNQLAGIK